MSAETMKASCLSSLRSESRLTPSPYGQNAATDGGTLDGKSEYPDPFLALSQTLVFPRENNLTFLVCSVLITKTVE